MASFHLSGRMMPFPLGGMYNFGVYCIPHGRCMIIHLDDPDVKHITNDPLGCMKDLGLWQGFLEYYRFVKPYI